MRLRVSAGMKVGPFYTSVPSPLSVRAVPSVHLKPRWQCQHLISAVCKSTGEGPEGQSTRRENNIANVLFAVRESLQTDRVHARSPVFYCVCVCVCVRKRKREGEIGTLNETKHNPL